MINPHISLNPQNPPIHGAILRFNEDFYCEIHWFHEQSSDLAVDLSKSSSISEGYFIHFFVWVSVWHLDSGCILHNLCLSHFHLRSNVMCSIWELVFSEHRSLHRPQIWTDLSVSVLDLVLQFLTFHPVHHEILVWGEILRFTCKSLDKSSDFTDFINPWIYQIYLRTLIFPIFISSIESDCQHNSDHIG